MITIDRIGGNPLGISQYRLTQNNIVVAESFDHNRPDDLPTLLRKAADQVVTERSKYGDSIYLRPKQSGIDDTEIDSKSKTDYSHWSVKSDLQQLHHELSLKLASSDITDAQVLLEDMLSSISTIIRDMDDHES